MQRDHKHGTVARCDGELVFYVELTSVGPLTIGIERLAGAPEQSLQVDFRMVEADGVTARTVLAPAIKSNATCIVRGFRPTQPGTWQIDGSFVDAATINRREHRGGFILPCGDGCDLRVDLAEAFGDSCGGTAAVLESVV